MKSKIRAILYDPRDEERKLSVFLGRYATYGGDLIQSSQKAADALKIASDAVGGNLGNVFDAAVYLDIPEDNPLFWHTRNNDWARIETTRHVEVIAFDAPNLAAAGYVLTAICMCPDGFALFWRTFNESN